MDDYLAKPVSLMELRVTLEHWLADSESDPNPSSSPSPAHAGLDSVAVAAVRALDPDGSQGLLPKLARAYRDSASVLVEALTQALEKRDPTALAQAAHALKSSSASVGAMKIAEDCRELEALGRAGNTDGAGPFVEDIRGELVAVFEELATWN